MGSCVSRSTNTEHNNHSGPKETEIAENDDTVSASQVRSSDLHVAEPSDGSFALLYPELKFSKQKLPNNGTMDYLHTASSLVVKLAPSDHTPNPQFQDPTQRQKTLRQTSLTESEKGSENHPISPSSPMPPRIYAREA